jgi:hypothetical protein
MAQLAAQVSNADDPKAAFVTLTPDEQQLVIDYLKVGYYETSMVTKRASTDGGVMTGMTPLAAQCWTGYNSVSGYNNFGVKMFEFAMTIDRCDNGASMTNVNNNPQIYATVTPAGTLWNYEGVLNASSTGGVGWYDWGVYRQAKFSLCMVNGVGCVQSSYPWLKTVAHANGTFTKYWGG